MQQRSMDDVQERLSRTVISTVWVCVGNKKREAQRAGESMNKRNDKLTPRLLFNIYTGKQILLMHNSVCIWKNGKNVNDSPAATDHLSHFLCQGSLIMKNLMTQCAPVFFQQPTASSRIANCF